MSIKDSLKGRKYKLLLLIGKPGSGKSKYLLNYSKENGIPILDFDTILGQTIPKDKNINYIYDFVRGFLESYSPDEILIDKKAILYDKNSKIDLLDFLMELSTKKIVIATWNGYIDHEKNELVHVCDKLQKDFTYDLDKLDIKYIELK